MKKITSILFAALFIASFGVQAQEELDNKKAGKAVSTIQTALQQRRMATLRGVLPVSQVALDKAELFTSLVMSEFTGLTERKQQSLTQMNQIRFRILQHRSDLEREYQADFDLMRSLENPSKRVTEFLSRYDAMETAGMNRYYQGISRILGTDALDRFKSLESQWLQQVIDRYGE